MLMPAIARAGGSLLVSAGLAAWLVIWLGGSASAASGAVAGTPGSVQACAAYAYAAIERHVPAVPTSPACAGLSGAEVSQAAGNAVRMTLTSGTKAAKRRQAIAAARWTRAMIAAPAPATSSLSPSAANPGADSPGPGGVGKLAADLGALLAWLATAASGGWILIRWLLAGGSLRRTSATAVPSAVTLGHVSGGALGLLLWALFMATGWAAFAWTALGLLAPVAGLGMSVLLLGLPRPERAPLGSRRRAGFPVLAVALHGLFVVVVLVLVLTATVIAG